jgi:hypothetical protein
LISDLVLSLNIFPLDLGRVAEKSVAAFLVKKRLYGGGFGGSRRYTRYVLKLFSAFVEREFIDKQ